jgi:hypothetical protein
MHQHATLSNKRLPAMRLVAVAQFDLSTLTRHSLRNNISSLVTGVLIFQHRRRGKGESPVAKVDILKI